jgi:succinyl-CoA synthetase alpha subunit
MAAGFVVRKNRYFDSVFLMGVNKRLSQLVGVRQTAVLMGSENNKRLLADIGIGGAEIEAAQPSDLIVAVIADSPEIVEQVLDHGLEAALIALEASAPASKLHTLAEGLQALPAANLAVLTIPGEHVYREASKALESNLNLFIFSSNVRLEEELQLKELAQERGLLVMGPDCGTSILNGVGLGFANAVRRGAVGAIGPSGTGLQEFTCQIHHSGLGISHALGTGSRDLSAEIGGITTFAALEALEADPTTQVIAIIAKPPGRGMAEGLVARLEKCSKPVVACLLGTSLDLAGSAGEVYWARTIDAAVQRVVDLSGGSPAPSGGPAASDERAPARNLRSARMPGQQFLRGVFAGGTFCYQSQQILRDAGVTTFSNAPLDEEHRLADPLHSREHTLVDMGDEVFTLGRPHPMIDSSLRAQRVLAEFSDPSVAVLLVDFILGYNAAMDPVGEILEAVLEGRQRRPREVGDIAVVASMCGTEDDPQDLALQSRMLREAGLHVFSSNARAASFCCELLKPD